MAHRQNWVVPVDHSDRSLVLEKAAVIRKSQADPEAAGDHVKILVGPNYQSFPRGQNF